MTIISVLLALWFCKLSGVEDMVPAQDLLKVAIRCFLDLESFQGFLFHMPDINAGYGVGLVPQTALPTDGLSLWSGFPSSMADELQEYELCKNQVKEAKT